MLNHGVVIDNIPKAVFRYIRVADRDNHFGIEEANEFVGFCPFPQQAIWTIFSRSIGKWLTVNIQIKSGRYICLGDGEHGCIGSAAAEVVLVDMLGRDQVGSLKKDSSLCGADRAGGDAGAGARWCLSFLIHTLTSLTLENWVSFGYVDDVNSRVLLAELFSSVYVDGARTLHCPNARYVNVYPTRSMSMSVTRYSRRACDGGHDRWKRPCCQEHVKRRFSLGQKMVPLANGKIGKVWMARLALLVHFWFGGTRCTLFDVLLLKEPQD